MDGVGIIAPEGAGKSVSRPSDARRTHLRCRAEIRWIDTISTARIYMSSEMSRTAKPRWREQWPVLSPATALLPDLENREPFVRREKKSIGLGSIGLL